MIPDRSNVTDDNNGQEGSLLPPFTDVKMFVDSLLIEFKTNTTGVGYEIERNLMTCTPFRDDYLYCNSQRVFSQRSSRILCHLRFIGEPVEYTVNYG